MNHQDSFDFENLVFTPTDSGLQMSPPFPPPLPLVQDFENFDFLGLQMSPPSLPHLPLLPSHMNNTDVAQSAEALNLQGAFELPDFTSTPTDVELVRDHLLPATQRMVKESTLPWLVNGDLPSMAPWELPGMIARNNKGGMRDKYYLTDHRGLRFCGSFDGVRTTNGFWQNHAHVRMIWAEHRGVGVKKTMKFHTYTGTKTNWIMNVYYLFYEENFFVEDDLVLCHVFETDSPDYDDGPKCLGCQPGACSGNHSGQAVGAPSNASFNSPHPGSWPMHHDQDLTPLLADLSIFMDDPDLNNSAGNHCDQAFGAPSNASFNSTHPGSWPMHHHDTERRSDPFFAGLGNLFDHDNSADTGNHSATRGVPPMADHGHSKKRKKSSDVWDYFTKIFARDINGNVLTFAACNHCCRILSGSSKNGTNHLARHACPCKFKPVAAGRNAKGSGGDVNVLWS